jgi:predicted transcriptional regulator
MNKKSGLPGLPLQKKYRSNFEIIALVLEAAKSDGATRFSIMQNAGINCMQLNKYLKPLTEIGFVRKEADGVRVMYRASEEGLEFLRQYYVLLGMLLTPRALSKPMPPAGREIVQPIL